MQWIENDETLRRVLKVNSLELNNEFEGLSKHTGDPSYMNIGLYKRKRDGKLFRVAPDFEAEDAGTTRYLEEV